MSDAWGIGGATALSLYTPDAAAAFTEMVRGAPPTSTRSCSSRCGAATVHAIIWPPATMRPRDLSAAREHLSPAEAIEVVDVAHNATNMIAVSLAAGEAESPTTVASFEVDDDFNLRFP